MRISDWSSDVCSSDLIGVPPFILPAETFAAPDIGPAVAAAGLIRALFEGEPLALAIGGDRVEDTEQRTQIIEMTMRGLALLQLDVLPFLAQIMWRHAHSEKNKGT